jgi:hypothetical protein
MKITATMATMPARIKSLKQAVGSIITQVDELWVYLNNFTSVPEFLINKKIKVSRSNEELGDIGDAGKFYRCEEIEGYHFTIDDDLIYPPDYVKIMVAEIERHQRKCIISCHGRVFKQEQIKSYYKEYKQAVSCLRQQNNNVTVHVGGTGVMAYYSGTIQLSIADFKAANMADIWMGIAAKNQGVKIIAIAHKLGWIKEGNYDRNFTIYNFCHNNDKYQTEVVNSEQWDVL